MESNDEIAVELMALSEPVSRISRESPYGVPAGYFDRFPTAIMTRIAAGNASAFHVPDGYFDSFAGNVLARIRKGMGEETVDQELTRLSALLSGISRKTPYEAPQGYIDSLTPVLAVLKDQAAYQVPAGYFAELPAKIRERIGQPAVAAKVIPMERAGGKVLKGHWWKFSSAAAIAACLLLIFSWPQVGNEWGQGGLDINIGLQKVSDQDLQSYLDDQHSILSEPVSNSTATLGMNEGDVNNLLGEVSDDDLQQYMEEHGKADDIATN
jgi:hypothetical protein